MIAVKVQPADLQEALGQMMLPIADHVKGADLGLRYYTPSFDEGFCFWRIFVESKMDLSCLKLTKSITVLAVCSYDGIGSVLSGHIPKGERDRNKVSTVGKAVVSIFFPPHVLVCQLIETRWS